MSKQQKNKTEIINEIADLEDLLIEMKKKTSKKNPDVGGLVLRYMLGGAITAMYWVINHPDFKESINKNFKIAINKFLKEKDSK